MPRFTILAVLLPPSSASADSVTDMVISCRMDMTVRVWGMK